jgi:ABC-type glycerol-3-phosphate transport system substrate-binding protein
MTDPKAFPNVEPPLHPEPKTSAPSPLNVMEPAPVKGDGVQETPPGQEGNQPITSYMSVSQPVVPPKKGFPKVLIFILVGVVIIIGIFSAMLALKNKKPTTLIGTKGEITWWGMEDEEIYAPLIDEFQKQNPNVRVKYEKQSKTDYRTRLSNSIDDETGPDIFEIHSTWVPMFKADLAPLPSNVMNKEEYTRTFYPVVSSDFTSDGEIVGIPLEYDALTMFINEDIFTSALKAPPKTWDEVAQLGLDLTQRDSRKQILQSGVALGITDNVDHWPEIVGLMALQNGANLSKEANSNQVKDALVYYAHFSRNDHDWDNTLPPSTSAFAKNKLAMYFAPTYRASEIAQTSPDLKFRTVPLPQLQKENPSDPDMSYATYWAQGVWNRSKNSEISWKFLTFLTTPESLQEINKTRKDKNLLEVAYPRPDMAVLQKDDKILGSIVALAPVAKSWYLASDTNDGDSGINHQLSDVFNELISAALGRGDINKLLDALPGRINQILASFVSRR